MPPLEVAPRQTRVEWLIARLLGLLNPVRATAGAEIAGVKPDAEHGRDLFIAKGCITCHRHDAISDVQSISSFSTGPNLTGYRPEPTFVREWLRDPKAIRPNTYMPTLGLSKSEIDALIAFLSSKSRGGDDRSFVTDRAK